MNFDPSFNKEFLKLEKDIAFLDISETTDHKSPPLEPIP